MLLTFFMFNQLSLDFEYYMFKKLPISKIKSVINLPENDRIQIKVNPIQSKAKKEKFHITNRISNL